MLKDDINKILEGFEANFLDGDKIADCGKAMVKVDEDFIEWIETAIKEIARKAIEAVEVKRNEIILKESNDYVDGLLEGYNNAVNDLESEKKELIKDLK